MRSGKPEKDNDNPNRDLWFDVDVALPRLARTLATQVHKIKAELELQCNGSNACVLEFENDIEKSSYKTEMVVLQTRLKATKLVLADSATSETDLKSYLQSFELGSGGDGSTQTGVADATAVSQAAPCSGHSHLMPVKALLHKIEDLKVKRGQPVTSPEGLRRLQDSLEPHIKALGELLRAMRSAQDAVYEAKIGAHGLKKAASDAQKKAANKRERLMQAADSAGKKKIKIEPVMDANARARESFKTDVPPELKVPLVSEQQLHAGEVSFSQPWLLAGNNESNLGKIILDEGFKKEVSEAGRMFKHSPERANPSRGKAKILFGDKSIAGIVAKAMCDVLPGMVDSDSLGGAFKTSAGPDLLVLTAQKLQVSFESCCLPALKWTAAGSKTIMIWNFCAIGHYVRSELGGRALKQPISSHAVNQYLLTLTPDKMKSMVVELRNSMRVATVAPGDLLYIPAGSIKAELPAQDDHISVRMSIVPLCNSADHAQSLRDLNVCQAELIATGRRNQTLDAVLGYLAKKPAKSAAAEAPKGEEQMPAESAAAKDKELLGNMCHVDLHCSL